MRWLGNHVRALGKLPQQQFDEQVRFLVLERYSRELLTVEAIQDSASTYPSYWTTALVRHRAAVLEALSEPAFYGQANISDARGGGSREEWQSGVAEFGELLSSWPEIWQTAAALNSRERDALRSQP